MAEQDQPDDLSYLVAYEMLLAQHAALQEKHVALLRRLTALMEEYGALQEKQLELWSLNDAFRHQARALRDIVARLHEDEHDEELAALLQRWKEA